MSDTATCTAVMTAANVPIIPITNPAFGDDIDRDIVPFTTQPLYQNGLGQFPKDAFAFRSAGAGLTMMTLVSQFLQQFPIGRVQPDVAVTVEGIKITWPSKDSFPGLQIQLQIPALYAIPYARVPKPEALLSRAYSFGAAYVSSDDLMEFLDEIFQLISVEDITQLDAMMRDCKVNLIAPELIVGMLRATANYATQIPNWKSFLNVAKKELSTRGFDAATVLAGLTDEQ